MEKAAYKQLTIPQTQSILQRFRGYFRDVFHVRDADPIPAFSAGRTMEYKKIVKKYGLAIALVLFVFPSGHAERYGDSARRDNMSKETQILLPGYP